MEEKRPIGAEIRVTSNAIKNYIDKKMSQDLSLEITGVESMTLMYIFRHEIGNVTAADLMQRFGVSKATTSQTISSLKDKGYIVQNVSSHDRRVKYIVLTKKGRELKKRFDEMFATINASVVLNLTEEEKSELVALLKRVQDNVGYKGGCCKYEKE